MVIIQLIPVILSLLLLAAHFFRAGFVPVVFIILASIFLLLIRRPWAARIVQSVLVAGSIEWIRTTINLVMIRQSMNMPWSRLALILGGIAGLALASAFVFRTGTLRRRFNLK